MDDELIEISYVMKIHSGATSNNVLWRVMSRGFTNPDQADIWLKYMINQDSEKNKHKYFVVSKFEKVSDNV